MDAAMSVFQEWSQWFECIESPSGDLGGFSISVRICAGRMPQDVGTGFTRLTGLIP